MQHIWAREEGAESSARDASRVAGWQYGAGFAGVFLCLFLASNRTLAVHDDGILLTGAMRILAGQVIHRDFYYNYGPATLYLVAGLFKLFGPSVLAIRLLGLMSDALLVISIYAITRRLCQQRVAVASALFCMVWLFGIGCWSLLTVFMLWATWLMTKMFQQPLSARRALAAGVLAGVTTLFRYDMGVGLIACHVLTAAVAIYLRRDGSRSWASMARGLCGYAAGVTIVVGPPAWAYLRVAPLHDLLFDVVLYNARYYRLGRGLPWPWRHLSQLQDIVVYALIAVMAMSLYVAARYAIARRQQQSAETEAVPAWIGLLISFSILAAMSYAKGVVRISAGGEAVAAMPCIVLAAVLYQHRQSFATGLRKALQITIAVMLITTAWGALHPLSSMRKSKSSTLLWMLVPRKMAPQPPLDGWCRDGTPITRGECYLLDSDHIRTVEFLDAHTRPGDTLYVGLPQHDRVVLGDDITYFATQRLPATKWSQFDPFLQNSAPIQSEMIADLERNKPPYVVLDSEFDAIHEPNGSSVHTDVHLLDEYIQQHYHWVQSFGEMTVLERTAG